MSSGRRGILPYVVALAVLSSTALHPSVANAADENGLKVELAPYVWASGIDGKMTIGSRSASFSHKFDDLVDHVDAAFMGLAIVTYDHFVLYGDYDYMGLSVNGRIDRDLIVPLSTKAQVESDLRIGTLVGGYRLDVSSGTTVDVMLGIQTTDLDNSIRVAASKFSSDPSLQDMIIAVRPSLPLSERWRFDTTITFGISGDSQTTYSLMPQFKYQLFDAFALAVGYKRLYYSQDEGAKGTPKFDQFHARLDGLTMGIGWRFPSK